MTLINAPYGNVAMPVQGGTVQYRQGFGERPAPLAIVSILLPLAVALISAPLGVILLYHHHRSGGGDANWGKVVGCIVLGLVILGVVTTLVAFTRKKLTLVLSDGANILGNPNRFGNTPGPVIVTSIFVVIASSLFASSMYVWLARRTGIAYLGLFEDVSGWVYACFGLGILCLAVAVTVVCTTSMRPSSRPVFHYPAIPNNMPGYFPANIEQQAGSHVPPNATKPEPQNNVPHNSQASQNPSQAGQNPNLTQQ